MRLILIAVGRLKAGPERDLFERYASRARTLGRGLGFAAFDVIEVDEGRGRSAAERHREEAAAIRNRLPPQSATVALDERGHSLPSTAFAERLAAAVARGTPSLAMLIGGPDGLDDSLRAQAGEVLSFGAATLPHQLARVVLAEQVYRAFTILSGHPYHRA